jgi:hypothetical protein
MRSLAVFRSQVRRQNKRTRSEMKNVNAMLIDRKSNFTIVVQNANKMLVHLRGELSARLQ